LVGIRGHVLALAGLDDADGVVDKEGKVGDAVVDVGGFVNAD
jgi:hypothetical protein